jgi:glycosyltransferase involved in cell wall biosynthesis
VGTGPVRTELESLVSHLGLEGKVYLLGQRSDLPDVYASFDIFVLPSFDEGMPMAILEAMAAGVPVIATRVGGIPKMISNQVSGLLVEPDDVGGLTRALEQFLQQPEKAAEMAGKAFEDVQNRFSGDAMARNYLIVYHKVLPAVPNPVESPAVTKA